MTIATRHRARSALASIAKAVSATSPVVVYLIVGLLGAAAPGPASSAPSSRVIRLDAYDLADAADRARLDRAVLHAAIAVCATSGVGGTAIYARSSTCVVAACATAANDIAARLQGRRIAARHQP